MGKRLTTEVFVQRAKQVHGDKFDYSESIFTGTQDPVRIICKVHGVFSQQAWSHLCGSGCLACSGKKQKTTEEFINKAKIIHGDKYNYSLSRCNNLASKVIVICPDHGQFKITYDSHINLKTGCEICRYGYKKVRDKKSFLQRAREVHGDKFDYSHVDYKKSTTDVKIYCPDHGFFNQSPKIHISAKHGCPRCSPKYPNKDKFIQTSKAIHKNKYDYSLVEYKNNTTKVKIICPQHGIYEQIPNDHTRGFGCARCSGVARLSTKEFIKRSKLTHGERFDYSLSQYKNKTTKVKIICSIHGVFKQFPQHHMNGNSCPACSKKKRKTTQSFIEEAKRVHGDKYDYSKSVYKNNRTKLVIICQEHGEVFVNPYSHLNGGQCPECNTPQGESLVKQFLIENDIKFEQQKRFEDCVFKKHLLFDFFLPDYNTIIEFDGEQHFKPIKYYGGEKTFKTIQKRDKVKNQYCIDNKIKLIRVPYFKQNDIQNILQNKIL